MKEQHLLDLLDKQVDIYLNCIAVELEDSHHQRFDSFGFPLFGETSKQYHEQVYFQSYLESYTRKMINSILKEIIDEDVADEIVWPEFDYPGIYKGYTNIECEREFGFEFINRSTNIGYRYSFFRNDEIEDLLTKANVGGIELVLWEGKDAIIGFDYDDERVKVVLLYDFFQELFVDLDDAEINRMYQLITKKVTDAVARANSMISLSTLPGFTPSYLYKTRNHLIAELRKEVNRLSCFSVNNPDFKQIEENSKKLIDSGKLAQFFLSKKYEYVFVGTSDFAKSYLTSEYLYRYFKDNPMFDYTPIVSGYLKSIEQLLHAIYASYLKANNIQKNLSDYTLGKYTTDIQKERIFRKELIPEKGYIIACLHSYRKESRNNLFHKDYFNSWDKVEQIRKNTIFLYVVLLGAVYQSLLIGDPTVLGLLNTEYDRLFCALDEYEHGSFSFVLDGKEYSEMSKEPRSKGLVFNENGLIMNTIIFKKYIYDHFESIEITRANMPSEMWIVDARGKKISRIWPT